MIFFTSISILPLPVDGFSWEWQAPEREKKRGGDRGHGTVRDTPMKLKILKIIIRMIFSEFG